MGGEERAHAKMNAADQTESTVEKIENIAVVIDVVVVVVDETK